MIFGSGASVAKKVQEMEKDKQTLHRNQ